MLWESSFIEDAETMPQTVPAPAARAPRASPRSPQPAPERAVPASPAPADIQQLLRLLAAPPSPPLPAPAALLYSKPPLHHGKPPPPYPALAPADAFHETLYDFNYPTPSPSSDEGSIPSFAIQPAEPYDSFGYSPVYIKEEPSRLSVPDFGSPYPLSPSGSCVSYTSTYLSSPTPQHDEYIDIEELLKENQILQEHLTPKLEIEECRDHALLRTALEDTSFQRRLNLTPFELGAVKMEESSGGAGGAGGGGGEGEGLEGPYIDRVLTMAIEQSKRDVDNTCTVLGISPDPQQWSACDVKAWLMFTLQHFQLPMVQMEYFHMDGAGLTALAEDDFNQRAPQAGSTLFAQLEIWKAARPEGWCAGRWGAEPRPSAAAPAPAAPHTPAAPAAAAEDISDDEEVEPAAPAPGQAAAGSKAKSGSTHIHLWQFLKELLASPQQHGSAIRWLERSSGVFKIEDSVRVARLWGKRKNRPAMNYDKLSRSIRQYYKKGIMKKTERSQRLVYQFCHPYCL